ncbi:ADP-ribosylglycohydrolase family protein [Edwardsiella tarda]|uniref:ADP-ribosylglycohydrolase family protein n=1 Tax=Edwardsiella tarda TaxID=636 RepID=UPI00351C81F7
MNKAKEQRIINSALWAAAGDAIGWISELTDEHGLKRRTGHNYLHMPLSWERKVGGYAGVNVTFPAGTYSDDTQLRLAVSRAITGDGKFDIESFAKIELTVWLSYALGAGRATKAAATNLMKKDNSWFSNFYNIGNSNYIYAGGNGTAMRIQPHVWSCKNLENNDYTTSVVKDSLVTHGHLLAVCGAILHANSIKHALITGKPATPAEIRVHISELSKIKEIIHSSFELNNFWLPVWEDLNKSTLGVELEKIQNETHLYLNKCIGVIDDNKNPNESFKKIIDTLDCKTDNRRGAATNTALASSLLCYIFKDSNPYEAILATVNELGIDTDSIASMAGAILGCYSEIPKWDIQDSEYIINEAKRLSNISIGITEKSFSYPSINNWVPPQTQSDTLLESPDGNLFVTGLGRVNPIDNISWNTKNYSWQWMRFDYGQTILLKSKLRDSILTKENREQSIINNTLNLFEENTLTPGKTKYIDHTTSPIITEEDLDIDKLTSQLIKDGFNSERIGHYLIKIADKKGLDLSIAYAAIICKAFIARKK